MNQSIAWEIGDKLSGCNFTAPFVAYGVKKLWESYEIIGERDGVYTLLDSRGATHHVTPELVGAFYPHYKAIIGDLEVRKV